MAVSDLHERLAWIATLNRDALCGYDRADLTLRLRYAPQAAQQGGIDAPGTGVLCVLTFEMHEEPDAVTLTIKAPEAAPTTVDALFEPFLPAKSPHITGR